MWQSDPHYHRLVIVPPKMIQTCKECGCQCRGCNDDNSLDLHHQIEELTSKLQSGTNQIVQMEKDFTASHLFADQEITKLQEELVKLRDRYDRLYDSHKKLSKVNQGLEEKLLNVVNRYEEEKSDSNEEISGLQSRVTDARMTIVDLEEESERYRNDCNVAVQLLQCRPSNFVAHKLDTLPLDLQSRLMPHLSKDQITDMERREEPKQVRVHFPTFPPTMVYNIEHYDTVQIEPKTDGKSVPMTLIAKVLTQPPQTKRVCRTYICSNCKADIVIAQKASQTEVSIASGSRRSDDSSSANSANSNGNIISNSSSSSSSYSTNSSTATIMNGSSALSAGTNGSYVHKPSRATKFTTETEI